VAYDHHATGSDHQVIEWEGDVDKQEEAGHESVVGWNLAATTEEDANGAKKQWMELAKDSAHLDVECTPDEVEQEAAWYQGALGSVLHPMAKKIRSCGKLNRWWNTDIRESRKAVRTEQRRRRNSEEAANEKVELQKSFPQSKRKMRSNYLQNLREAEVWRAAQYTNPRAGITVEALTYGEGKPENTPLEKVKMQRRESFLPDDDDLYYELPPAGSIHTHVTEQTVEQTLLSQLVKKGTRAVQAVLQRSTAAPKVGPREDCENDEGGDLHRKTPICIEAG